MKTYHVRVVLEPDEGGWFVFAPGLERYGAATWGQTREQAIKYIRDEVLPMVLEELLELGIPIPEPAEEVGLPPEEGALVWEESVSINSPGGGVQ